METIGAYEAKTHLSQLLDRVAKGERFVISRHGSPVAVLQPADVEKQIDIAAVIQKMRLFRRGVRRGVKSALDSFCSIRSQKQTSLIAYASRADLTAFLISLLISSGAKQETETVA